MSDREWPTDDTTEAERAEEAAYWRAEDARHAAAEAEIANWETLVSLLAEEDGEEPPDPWSANDGW